MLNRCGPQVAFPYLYNNRPRKVRLSVYHYPMVMYIKAEDPDLPAFYFDPLINPMPSYKSELRTAGVPELTDQELDDFELPEGIEPFLPVNNTSYCLTMQAINTQSYHHTCQCRHCCQLCFSQAFSRRHWF